MGEQGRGGAEGGARGADRISYMSLFLTTILCALSSKGRKGRANMLHEDLTILGQIFLGVKQFYSPFFRFCKTKIEILS